MVVCSSLRPFLSSLRKSVVPMPFSFGFFLFSLRRRIWGPFSSTIIFFCPCTGEFVRHFVCGKSLQETGFFYMGEKILTKNIFGGFFSRS